MARYITILHNVGTIYNITLMVDISTCSAKMTNAQYESDKNSFLMFTAMNFDRAEICCSILEGVLIKSVVPSTWLYSFQNTFSIITIFVY